MKKIIGGILLGALFLFACEKDKGLWYSKQWEKEHPYGQFSSAASAASAACDTSGTISYSVTVQPIITSNCATTASCHISHGGALNYNVFANVVADAQGTSPNDIMTRINLPISSSSHMPQSLPSLATCDIAKIRGWINQGCQNN